MASRTRARELSVQLIYQHHFSGNSLEEDIQVFFENTKADAGTQEFTNFNVRGVLDHARELDMEISAYLKNWTLDRLVLMDRIILQIAFFELLHNPEVPWKVVVDEAVMLGRMFSEEKSAVFINGVLHAWAVKNRDQEAPVEEA